MPTPRRTPAQRLADLDARRARLRHTISSAERRADAHRKIVLGAVVAAAAPDLDGDLLAGVLLALLETGADAVDLTWRKVWTPAGVGAPLALSRSTLWRGIKALEESQFIAASPEPGRYWVNPARLFAGDRLRLVREYRIGVRKG